jgi:outer membrane protein assembly factor BamD
MTLKRWFNWFAPTSSANFNPSCMQMAGLLVALALSACGSGPKDDAANWSADKLYEEAKSEASAGQYERAAGLYERLEGRATGTLLSQQAQLERAFILNKSGEKAQALSVLERFIKYNPTSPGLDYAYYLQGLINFNENLGIFGNWAGQDISERDQQAARDSYQSFRTLVEQFPQSRYAEDSRLRINFIFNSLAAYEVHVARYYLRRGAYVAAANRAQQAVKDFQGADAVPEALELMVKAYDKLGMTQLRDDAQRVLDKNFSGGVRLSSATSAGGAAAK